MHSKKKANKIMGFVRKFRELLIIAAMLLTAMTTIADNSQPGCQTHCGNITIPYPFGTSNKCSLNGNFIISCNTSFNPPKAFLYTDNVEVLDISLDGQLRIQNVASYECYGPKSRYWNFFSGLIFTKFTLSRTRNKCTAVGCDTYVFIEGYTELGQRYSTGCVSFCNKTADVIDGTCSGTGCCQQDLPERGTGFDFSFSSWSKHADILSFNPCSYAFVVEDGAYTFSVSDLYGYNMSSREFPLILDWTIGNQTCKEAIKDEKNYACRENTACMDPADDGFGFLCKCLDGFQGNPYVSNGCQDINECETLKPCNGSCHNLVGSYNCSCPEGYKGDGRINGTGCSLKASSNGKFPILDVTLGVGISVLAIPLLGSCLYFGLRQRKLTKVKQSYFKQNGGLLLWEELSKREDFGETPKIFTVGELRKATNNYHESRILGRGGQGTVYRGILPDGRNVAIKKSIIVDQTQVQQFINEMIVLTQINHRNVVKLLGCCLETQVPLLVYEYISNGTLFSHLHSATTTVLPWEMRLKIATETAQALSYLHSAASPPIIHRDVKLTNILLDDNYIAKVSDFGCSRLIPLDKAQITTLVRGTLGYLDPEYLLTSQLTEKSDVYSFGVVLTVLITGLEVLCFERPEEDRNLAMFFVSVMKEDRLLDILDERILQNDNIQQLKEVAILARRCVRVKGEERPTMKEVASELEGMLVVKKQSSRKDIFLDEEDEHLLHDLGEFCTFDEGSTSNTISVEYYSINSLEYVKQRLN